MIKKLRIKLILTNILLITTVLIISFSVIFIQSAKELEKRSIETMQTIALTEHGKFDHLFDINNGNSDEHPYISTYVLDINTGNKTCYIEGYGSVEDLNSDDSYYINEIIKAVFTSNTTEGELSEYNMRFFVTDMHFGKRIVLLDQRYEDDYLRQLIISLILSFFVAFVFLSIVSFILSSISIKPIEKSLKQQQQLISDVSHELKTPLTIISTNADIVLSHEDSIVENEKKWLGYIKDETSRMSDLISMMLYLAKSDESQKKPILQPLDLSNLAYEIALSFESVCFENGKSFTFSIEDDISICADEGGLKQLLLILLDNAVKYSNDGGRIELSISKKNENALVSVFNTGVPIPKENIPSLFERFYRVDQSRTRETGGSGLGLSIAKRIIEENEGAIAVSSSLDNGIQFICSFKINNKTHSNK